MGKLFLKKTLLQDPSKVEHTLETSLTMFLENRVHLIVVIRFIENLVNLLSKIQMNDVTEKEWGNLTHALNFLKEYDRTKPGHKQYLKKT